MCDWIEKTGKNELCFKLNLEQLFRILEFFEGYYTQSTNKLT